MLQEIIKNDIFSIEINKKIWRNCDHSEAFITTKLQENCILGLSLYMRVNENEEHPSSPPP
jgi:hypothetical protein